MAGRNTQAVLRPGDPNLGDRATRSCGGDSYGLVPIDDGARHLQGLSGLRFSPEIGRFLPRSGLIQSTGWGHFLWHITDKNPPTIRRRLSSGAPPREPLGPPPVTKMVREPLTPTGIIAPK